MVESFVYSLRFMMIVSILIGIGINSFTLFKVSEVLYFFTFLIFYGRLHGNESCRKAAIIEASK